MATYTKFISETKNVFVKKDGNLIMQQILQDKDDGFLHCTTVPATAELATQSSEQEYNDVGDEILVYGRIGSRPSSAP